MSWICSFNVAMSISVPTKKPEQNEKGQEKVVVNKVNQAE
jgi:hypothetical protein